MLNSPTEYRDMLEDALERLYYWIDVLEKRIDALLDMSDPELMSPAQRQQAAIRYLKILPRFLQLRQKYAKSSIRENSVAYVNALIDADDSDIDENGRFKLSYLNRVFATKSYQKDGAQTTARSLISLDEGAEERTEE